MEDDSGSKMHIVNLATVLAPNILYSKSKDPTKDESFFAIETVTMMLQNAEEFATVPEDFIPLLQNLSYEEGDMDLNVRHILKKCEMVMKLKRTKAAGGPIAPQLPRQHSSPAAVSTLSNTANNLNDLQYPQHQPLDSNNNNNNNSNKPSTAYHLSSSPIQDSSLMSEMDLQRKQNNNNNLAPIPILRSQSSSQLNPATSTSNVGQPHLIVKQPIQ